MGRSWKGFTAEDFRKYYEENYGGLSRGEVQKADGSFYGTVWDKGFLNSVFPERKRRTYQGWKLEDFKSFYEEHYPGMGRSEVAKEDCSFYATVLRKKFADDVFPPIKTKPDGYWKDPSNIQNELEKTIEQLGGRFPTYAEINKMNSSLAVAIKRHLGGIRKVREKYGVESNQRPHGYWTEIDNVQKELDLIMEELGRFPTQREIQKRNCGLMKGIAMHHGGLNKIREMCGEKQRRKPDGYYKDINNIHWELELIIEELGEKFPTCKEINEKNSSLATAIQRHHGGYIAMKIKLGYADEELDVLRKIVEEVGMEETIND